MIGGACNGVQAVEGGERLHFVARELLGGRAHLLIDIILAAAFGECRKLPFNIGSVLPLQRRRAEFEAAGAMTGGTGRNAALRIAGKYQPLCRIACHKPRPDSGTRSPVSTGNPPA
jgi:hypothetical protein